MRFKALLCALAVVIASVYLYTMNPSVSVGDSGEFIAASQTLSIPHAPSYPLYSLLGKVFTHIFPMGSVAYRVNLLSLISGIGACLLFFSLSRLTGLSFSVSFVSTLVFSFSRVIWEHSLSTEVFTLNTFFCVLLLWIWLLPSETCSGVLKICLSALLLGLGLGNHQTLVIILLPILTLYAIEGREKALSRDLILGFSFFMLGFFIYIYLPIRSIKNPPLDWSNPETLYNFYRVISRADYGSLSLTLGEKLPRNFETAFQQAYRYLAYMAENISLLGLIISTLGWIPWFMKDRKTALSMFVFFGVSGIGFLILGNLPFDSQSSGILPRFFMMPAIPLILSLGWFLEWMKGTTKTWALLALFIIPYTIFSGWNVARYSRQEFVAHDYGRNLLKTLPPSSVLFMDGGDDTFYTLAYFSMAEGRRPDLKIHDRGGLIFKNPYGEDFRRLVKSEKENRRQSVESTFLQVKPLYYSTFDKKVLKGARLEPRGILYEALPDQANRLPQRYDPWQFYSLRGIYETKERPYRLRALIPLYPFLEGIQQWNLAYIRRAVGFGSDIQWLKANVGWELSFYAYELTQLKKNQEAEAVYKYILQVDPQYSSAYTNLGVLASDRNDFPASEAYYKKSIEMDPTYADAYFNMAVLYWKQNRWKEVIDCLKKTLKHNPAHPVAEKYLGAAEMKLKGL